MQDLRRIREKARSCLKEEMDELISLKRKFFLQSFWSRETYIPKVVNTIEGKLFPTMNSPIPAKTIPIPPTPDGEEIRGRKGKQSGTKRVKKSREEMDQESERVGTGKD